MRKLLLSALAVCAFTFANAQEESTSTDGSMSKGGIMISETVGFESESQDLIKSNDFNFSPSATYLVSNNIGIGARVGYGAGKGENATIVDLEDLTMTTHEETKTSTMKLGAFGRYFITPSSKFSVFGELGFDYVASKSEYTNAGVTTENPDNTGFDVAVGPGICYFVSEHFAIEANWGL